MSSIFTKQDLTEIINDLMGREDDAPLPLLFEKQIKDLIAQEMTLKQIAITLIYMVDYEDFEITERFGIKQALYTKDRAMRKYNELKEDEMRQKREAQRICDNHKKYYISPKQNTRKIPQIDMKSIKLGDE